MDLTPPVTILNKLTTSIEAIHRGAKDGELDGAPVLSDWFLANQGFPYFSGFGQGHPRLPDGIVYTSMALFIAPDLSHARTLSRWYRLGKMKLPDAKGPEHDFIPTLDIEALPAFLEEMTKSVHQAAYDYGRHDIVDRIKEVWMAK